MNLDRYQDYCLSCLLGHFLIIIIIITIKRSFRKKIMHFSTNALFANIK
jgi:hypothetical protein